MHGIIHAILSTSAQLPDSYLPHLHSLTSKCHFTLDIPTNADNGVHRFVTEMDRGEIQVGER